MEDRLLPDSDLRPSQYLRSRATSRSILDLDRLRQETFVSEIEHFQTIGSTNDRAAERAGQAAAMPLLVLADEQTAGRGRGPHTWWTGAGSLAFSLLLDAIWLGPPRTAQSGLVALAAGVATAETARRLVTLPPIRLRWPNDVLAGDGKLAGILIEVLPGGQTVIGIGLNVNNRSVDAPADLRSAVATLYDLTSADQSLTDVLISLLKDLERQFAALRREPEQVIARANEFCLQVGKNLRVRQGATEWTGRCRGIAADGALEIETAEGVRAVYSGEIDLLRSPPPLGKGEGEGSLKQRNSALNP